MDGLPLVSKADLSEADDQDGNPTYVAVFGYVYDDTDIAEWPNGEYNGISAGTDETDNFENDSPHEDDLLSTLKIVRKHVDYVFLMTN